MESPVNVDVEAKVSEESTKQLVEVIADVLSPATEILGVLGDNIRVYRTNAAIRTFQKTQKLAEDAGIKLKMPPIKFLIPFIEEASLEEDESEITDLWAKLLYSASTAYSDHHRSYIAIVKDLTPLAAKILNATIDPHGMQVDLLHDDAVRISLLDDFANKLEEKIIQDFEKGGYSRTDVFIAEDAMDHKYESALDYIHSFRVSGVLIRGVEIKYGKTPISMILHPERWSEVLDSNQLFLETLLDLRLLDRLGLAKYNFTEPWRKIKIREAMSFRIRYLLTTEYGVGFLEAVNPSLDDTKAKRKKLPD